MKRFLHGLAAAGFAVAIVGCGGNTGKIDTPAVDPNDTATVSVNATDAKPSKKKPPAANVGQQEKMALPSP